MAPITRCTSLIGPITESRVSLTPWTILRKSPWCLAASARVASLPSTAALLSVTASATNVLTASTHWFRLFLIVLKSPL